MEAKTTSPNTISADHRTIVVVGGGIAGITAALEAAEAGYEVVILERGPYLGGRVAQLNKYFPKLCPPNCGLEINFQRIRNSAPHTIIVEDGERKFDKLLFTQP